MASRIKRTFDDFQAEQSSSINTVQAASEATRRFFDTPELVRVLLSYLSTDRIDLLTLSLVSKTLRVQALQVWISQLYIPFPAASNRLNFLKANPTLLDHIRYLRLRNIPADFDSCRPIHEFDSREWCKLDELLQMLAEHAASSPTPPLIDLTMFNKDPLRLPAALAQRVVALHITVLSTDEHVVPPGRDDNHITEELSTRLNIGGIVDILYLARQGPGLSCFEMQINDHSQQWPSFLFDGLWRQLVQHAPTLRKLSLLLRSLSFPTVLSTTAFDHLQDLYLDWREELQLEVVEGLLDGANNLQALELWGPSREGEALSMRQTFPQLHHISLGGVHLVDHDRARKFAARHPGVVSAGGIDLLRSDDRTLIASSDGPSKPAFFPQLKDDNPFDSTSVEQDLHAGRTFTQSSISILDHDDLERCLTLLHAHPAAAQNLSCLVLWASWKDLHDFFTRLPRMVDSQGFPNLIELHLRIEQDWKHEFDPRRFAQFELGIGRVMTTLMNARSLRVLGFFDSATTLRQREILYDHEFPPALEYFTWNGADDEPSAFRYVSSHPEGRIVRTETGGKKGHLQRVAPNFWARISKAGVWHRIAVRHMPVVLDHLDAPFL